MTSNEYIKLLRTRSCYELADLVDQLTHFQRIELRKALEQIGCKTLIRNLYFDYKLQVWMD